MPTMLESSVRRLAPSPGTGPQASAGEVQDYAVAEGTLTSAQILALFATPITVITAPGAGLANVIIDATFWLNAATAYAGIAAGEDLVLAYTDASGAQASPIIEATGFLDQATAQVRHVQGLGLSGGTTGADVAPVANAAIVAKLLVGEITTGTGVLKYRIGYKTIPTVAPF